VTFVDRTYPDIVRDVLTTLTQGVVAETHTVTYDPTARPLVLPDIVLTRRPVRRVSMVSGFVPATTPGDPPVATLFSLNDYKLVPNPDDPGDVSRIRFNPLAKRKPAPNTDVTVNYYPRTTDPTPLTDLNVGSVVRTIVEAMGRELGALYAQLNIAYDSGFLDTATGASLDRVVALLSYARRRAGRAVGSVTFTRRAGSIGSITIPAGTPITDTADKIRYLTSERYDMLAGESTAEVRVQGVDDATSVVEAAVLTVIQRAIAGLDSVTNARPTSRATDDETDEALRARTRDALLAANKGTPQAIRHGLLALPQVRDANVEEMPNGVPGEIRVTVSLAQPPPPGADLPQEVLDRIEELRPAGIRVLRGQAGQAVLAASVSLVLAGSSMAPADVEAVHQAVRDRLVAEIGRKGVGERIRAKPLVAALLADSRIADATLAIGVKGGTPAQPGEDFQPDSGSSVSLDPADIAFGPDSFATAPSAAGQPIRVEVRAIVGATPLSGVTIDAMKAELTARLTSYLTALAPGASVDSASLLLALANDAKYGIDPLKLSVTLTADDQFAQIAQGGQAFTVKPGQSFALISLDLAT
jgi:uncharacterized phage protein gp47/JayE